MADGVVFLPSFHEAIRELPDEERLAVYDAVIHYGLYGEIIEMPSVVKALFALMKPVIDSSQRRYRQARINGSLPPKDPDRPRGRPSKKQNKNQTKNQTGNQDIDLDSEKEKDSYFDLDSEKEFSDFPKPYKPLTEADFEMQREAKLAALNKMVSSGFNGGSDVRKI